MNIVQESKEFANSLAEKLPEGNVQKEGGF